VIAPVNTNAVVLSWVYNTGGILLDPTIPITDVQAQFQTPIVSLYRTFGFFGRSANVTASLPYAYGNFQGKVREMAGQISRSGLGDTRVRLSVNLYGGPAMELREYAKYHERIVVGASITMVAPSGQYDPAKLVNIGTNRWAFKPEMGLSRRWGRWALDAYVGAWLFTNNAQFFPGNSIRKQNPMPSGEFHFGYYVRPRLWVTFDSNLWLGGNTVVNGVENDDRARNSRVGGTASIPINRHQSFKFSASRGAAVRIGGNFTSISAGWQYSWISAK